MSNHLTPSELARESGLDRQDVIARCVELGVPIFHGKIDKNLFRCSMEQAGMMDGADGGSAGVSLSGSPTAT